MSSESHPDSNSNAASAATICNSNVLVADCLSSSMIVLNRPKELNVFDLKMIRKIHNYLKWSENQKGLIVMKGFGDRAFCGGADFRELLSPTAEKDDSVKFYQEVFSAMHLIANYRIPFVTIMDGITMGNGVGFCMHAKYCVATESTIIAVSEVAYGMTPDMGASYVLPRLQGKLGLYLALSGDYLRGEDVLKAGLATHYCNNEQICELEHALLKFVPNGENDVVDVLNRFHAPTNEPFILGEVMDQINKCFDADSVEEIIENLRNDDSKWAEKTLKRLLEMPPTALKVTFRLLKLTEQVDMPLEECLVLEFRTTIRHFARNDMREGINAMIADKEAHWQPPTLAEVSNEDVYDFFTNLKENDLKL